MPPFYFRYNGFQHLSELTLDRWLNAGVAFPFANLFSSIMVGHTAAIGIALINVLLALGIAAMQLKIIDCSLKKISNPLRITALCTALMGIALLFTPDATLVLYLQSASFFAFSVGNFIQSGTPKSTETFFVQIPKALHHPALWYGVGYTLTGITIGGAYALFSHAETLLFTAIGIVEILACLFMSMGKTAHRAGPFIVVAMGTVFLFLSGISTLNWPGAACALCAGLGELSLAMQSIQEHNRQGVKTDASTSSTPLSSGLERLMRAMGIPT